MCGHVQVRSHVSLSMDCYFVFEYHCCVYSKILLLGNQFGTSISMNCRSCLVHSIVTSPRRQNQVYVIWYTFVKYKSILANERYDIVISDGLCTLNIQYVNVTANCLSFMKASRK